MGGINFTGLTQGWFDAKHAHEQEQIKSEQERRAKIAHYLSEVYSNPTTQPSVRAKTGLALQEIAGLDDPTKEYKLKKDLFFPEEYAHESQIKPDKQTPMGPDEFFGHAVRHVANQNAKELGAGSPQMPDRPLSLYGLPLAGTQPQYGGSSALALGQAAAPTPTPAGNGNGSVPAQPMLSLTPPPSSGALALAPAPPSTPVSPSQQQQPPPPQIPSIAAANAAQSAQPAAANDPAQAPDAASTPDSNWTDTLAQIQSMASAMPGAGQLDPSTASATYPDGTPRYLRSDAEMLKQQLIESAAKAQLAHHVSQRTSSADYQQQIQDKIDALHHFGEQDMAKLGLVPGVTAATNLATKGFDPQGNPLPWKLELDHATLALKSAQAELAHASATGKPVEIAAAHTKAEAAMISARASELRAQKAAAGGDPNAVLTPEEEDYVIGQREKGAQVTLPPKANIAVVKRQAALGKDTPVALNAAAATALAKTATMRANTHALLSTLETLKNSPDWETPFEHLPANIRYKLGMDSDDALTQLRSRFSIQEWAGTVELLPGVRRGDILSKAKEHQPIFGKDSMKLMYTKLRNADAFYADKEKMIRKFGTKSGVPQGENGTIPATTAPGAPAPNDPLGIRHLLGGP